MENLLKEKASKIRLLISDVDGVLTSGTLFYGPMGSEMKDFSVYDGFGMKLLQQSGVHLAIITAKKSEAVAVRMQDLHIEHVYQGQSNKLMAYEDLKQKLNLDDAEIAYIADDLPDLPLLRRVGLPVSVPNAPQIIHEHVVFVTKAYGGKGAVRELCEIIMKAQGTYQSIIESYLI
ncbi:MAG TPA: HAD hydrolase family protein [Gammaproteobacteria bacterium]|nr:HAD hydrolase family protein [Gammaproteobacteria bacterium]